MSAYADMNETRFPVRNIGWRSRQSRLLADARADWVIPFLAGLIARIAGCRVADIYQSTRGLKRHARARHIVMYLAHVECGLDFSAIGRALKRDRSAVRHGIQLIEDARDDDRFDQRLDDLREVIKSVVDLRPGL